MWIKRQQSRMLGQMLKLVSLYMQTRFGSRTMVISSVLVQRKKWYSISEEDSPQGDMGSKWQKRCCWTFAASGHVQSSVLRLHCPGVNSDATDGGILSIHYCADLETIEYYFSHNCLLPISTVFTEQSQKCVKNMNPFIKEWGNPLWEGSRVPHSCQA